MEPLVCPECGHDEFQRKGAAWIEETGSVWAGVGFQKDDDSPQILDFDAEEEISCGNCGWTSYEDSDLITREAYDESEDDD